MVLKHSKVSVFDNIVKHGYTWVKSCLYAQNNHSFAGKLFIINVSEMILQILVQEYCIGCDQELFKIWILQISVQEYCIGCDEEIFKIWILQISVQECCIGCDQELFKVWVPIQDFCSLLNEKYLSSKTTQI